MGVLLRGERLRVVLEITFTTAIAIAVVCWLLVYSLLVSIILEIFVVH